MPRTVAFHALVVMVIGAGCRQGDIVGGVTDSAFVGTMIALQQINQDSSTDSVRRANARDSVLQSRGLTPEMLERAAQELAKDPERAASLLRKIAQPQPPARPVRPAGPKPPR